MDDADLLAIKDRAWERFSKVPGVHAVGIGKKVTAGVRTDETVLTVFVTKKVPLDQLSAAAVVPPRFEGVKTDIVERPVPRTLQGPIAVAPTSITTGQGFTFTTTVDPPPVGIRIVVTVTWHGGGVDKVFVMNSDSDGNLPLQQMLALLHSKLTGPFFQPTLTNQTLAISVSNVATESLDASCYILMMDTGAYAQEFLRGGIRIQGGSKESGGTMGCLATLGPTAEFPNGRVVGVTCSHVVRHFEAGRTGLIADDVDATTIVLTQQTDPTSHQPFPIPAHSVVYVGLLRNGVEASAFYTTQQNEPLANIAAGLISEIIATGLPGIGAAVVPISPIKLHIVISGFGGAGAHLQCKAHGPMSFLGSLSLTATVTRNPTGDHAVSLDGSVDSPHVGVFVDIDPGGFAATFGVYQNPLPTHTRADVAQAISTAINLFPSALRGLVSATAVGDTVTIASAKDVRIWIEPDVRVGQPINFFGMPTPKCCNFRIGRTVHARLDVDVALIQLDAGLKYKHHIQEVNAVAGTQTAVLGMAVQKRGAATGLSEGMVTAVATSGFILSNMLPRIYRNCVVVDSTILNTSTTRRAFAGPGDSGCAVLTRGPGVPKIVGVLFAGSADATAVITAIEDVVSAFSSLGLAFDPGVGVDLAAVHVVPQPAAQFRTSEADDVPLANGTSLVRPFAALDARIRQAEHEIASTPIGREYLDLMQRHAGEAFALVNHNRRVATVWHRSGGPELLTALLRVMRFDDEPLPQHINGRPLAECLSSLERAFRRCASPQCARDMARVAKQLGSLSGLTYPQMLATLRAGSTV
jgi:hypothetical protein